MSLSRNKTPRRGALWLTLPGRKPTGTPPGEQKQQGKAAAHGAARYKRPAPRKKAIWREAFPEQVDDRVAEHTAAEKRLYRAEAKEAVRLARRAGTCPVFAVFDQLPAEVQRFLTYPWNGKRRSNKINEIHHTHGRRGELLRFQAWWIAMSKWGHRAVHAFPKVARQFGWLCPEGQWNEQPPKQP